MGGEPHIISYKDFCEFIHNNITSDKETEELMKKFLLNDINLGKGEYVTPLIEGEALLGQSENLFLPSSQIYINLRKLTVLTLACLCDIFITKGVATALGVALGEINTCIYKIKERDECYKITKILYYCTISDGIPIQTICQEYTGRCLVKGNQRCCFLQENGQCNIKQLNIYMIIEKLVSNGVIERRNDIIFLA